MKSTCFLFFGVLSFFAATAQAQSIAKYSPDCARENVVCWEEFATKLSWLQSIEGWVQHSPSHMLQNVTFKRGNNIEKRVVGHLGPHGHLVSPNDSQSATPEQPRVIVWDEASGLSFSWNSGNLDHSAHGRVDIYDFDFDTSEHRLFAWLEKDGLVGADFRPSQGASSCTDCHGEVQRPIFPMYPDWPQFYGEFNDEMSGYPSGQTALRSDLRVMANEFQPIERRMYFDFLDNEAQDNLRYTPIFEALAQDSAQDHPYTPFRPAAIVRPFSHASRAFYHRPNLRLGVLYNRLAALQTFAKIKESPVFQQFPDVIFFALMDCNWDFVTGLGQQGRIDILGRVQSYLQQNPGLGLADMNFRGAAFRPEELSATQRRQFYAGTQGGASVYYAAPEYSQADYFQVPYEDLLKLLGLDIADIDIRFKHNSSLSLRNSSTGFEYNVFDPKAFYTTQSVMDIGYMEDTYEMNPICDNNNTPCSYSYDGTYMQGLRYFNSYFDGSATTNELLAAQMLNYLTDPTEDFSSRPELDNVRGHLRGMISNPNIYYETLMQKYRRFGGRLALDRTFFNRMDAMSPWIQLPYSPGLYSVQNRESFWTGGSTETRNRHAQWTSLSNRRNNVANNNGGNNLCRNIYTSMHRRYRSN